ncbi:MAG: hypothetical protein AAF417_19510 [Pseudomonadota bacterium]
MSLDELLPFVAAGLLLVALPFVVRILRRRSLTAALYDAAIVKTVGEISRDSAKRTGMVIKVHALDGGAGAAVGVEFGQRIGRRYGFTPTTLSAIEAEELVGYLRTALDLHRAPS